ncbi:MAG: AAA family ATPase [Frankiaceae bacterium]
MTFPGALFDPASQASPGTGTYVYHDERIVLAVNVALATRRPLLITGEPGSGKSTLARDVAQRLGWAYAWTTITSRTRLADLIASFDAVRRLADAQVNALKDDDAYLLPGVLWWSFDPVSARDVAGAARDTRIDAHLSDRGTVVLLDEIDKAEPDLPNDLLEPLDQLAITLPGGERRAASNALVVITSNGERTMPPAFLRRCILLQLASPDAAFLASVASSHFGKRRDALYSDIATRTLQLSGLAGQQRRRPPSTAEYLDAVKASLTFEQRPPTASRSGTALWEAIEEAALRKSPRSKD